MRAVVNALKTQKNVQLREHCCATLCFLYSDHVGGERGAASAGAVEAILGAMRAQTKHARVQLHGCGALANLCVINENRSRVVKMGGIKSIIDAIKVIVPKPQTTY